jgi:hypothetical protein
MERVLDRRTRVNLEQYLQDLICGVGNVEQVGVLVEALMALQHGNTVRENTKANAAGG